MTSGSQHVYLGVDIGTSGCRTIAVDSSGATLATADQQYPLFTPAPGWVEQDPHHWIEGALATISQVCASGAFDPAHLRGIGVDGQSWACVPVSEDRQVLANTPIWMDTRGQSICDELHESGASDGNFALSGNRLSPAYTTAKALWFQRHRPEVYARARWFLQCNSVIVMALTGAITQDHSQGYGWHCIDVATGAIDHTAAQRLGIDASRIPNAVESTAVAGAITEAAAARTGVPVGTPVVAGGLDAACGTLGAGVFEPGQTQEQGGQAGGMSIAVDAPIADERLILSRHVVADRWLLQGGTVAGSASLAWLARVIGAAEQQEAKDAGHGLYEEISTQASKAPRGSGGVIFLPYLSGERSPIWDADARGAFVGLHLGIDRSHLYRSVMEGTAMALRHNLEVAAAAGAKVAELRAVGGATKSPVWMQIKADVTGIPLLVSANDYATPLGAAMLAAIGVGDDTVTSLTQRWVQHSRRYQPNPAATADYDDYYQVYAGLYPALANSMHSLADASRPTQED